MTPPARETGPSQRGGKPAPRSKQASPRLVAYHSSTSADPTEDRIHHLRRKSRGNRDRSDYLRFDHGREFASTNFPSGNISSTFLSTLIQPLPSWA